MKRNYKTIVLDNHQIANDLYKMSLQAPEIAERVRPGEFVHIKVPKDESLLLRRPLSVNGVDRDKGQLDLVYQRVGKGTKIFASLKPGTLLDILGPLGKGFWIPDEVESIYIVGGGCGIAPVRFAAQEWSSLDITSFLGFRDKSYIYQVDDFEEFSNRVFISTDDGSQGYQGTITRALALQLKKKKPDLILGCGPTPMLRAVHELAESYDIPCQISLEERMGCGIGGCLVCSCAIKKKDGWDYKKVCHDGPVFWSKEVVLHESFKSKC